MYNIFFCYLATDHEETHLRETDQNKNTHEVEQEQQPSTSAKHEATVVEQSDQLERSKECPKRTCFRTTNPSEGIDIVMGLEGLAAVEPTTVSQVFKDTVAKIPNNPALR